MIGNKAVIDGQKRIMQEIIGQATIWLPKWNVRPWWIIRTHMRQQLSITTEWIPSHSKTREWDTETGYPKEVCRKLNEAADEEAGKWCER